MLSIKLNGLDNLIATVEKTAKRAESETKVALTKFAKNTETEAKRLAPANEGRLRNSVNGTVDGFTAKITVTADYAAYLEFGTRKFAARYVATLPQDWQSYAATFRGKGGGTFDQFIQDIMQWTNAEINEISKMTTDDEKHRVLASIAAESPHLSPDEWEKVMWTLQFQAFHDEILSATKEHEVAVEEMSNRKPPSLIALQVAQGFMAKSRY